MGERPKTVDIPGLGRALARRAALRPELRAASALEEAGELQEAARVLEYAGQHAHAALLRLEHARTVRDEDERIDGLREGCAKNPGTSPEARMLHRALAEILLRRVDVEAEPSRRRAGQLEAARALEEAGDGAEAGELYEHLGLLDRAARAYERGGELARLEVVLTLLERRDEEAATQAGIEREVDEAIADGRRRDAWLLLADHTARRARVGESPRPSLAARRRWLEAHRIDAGRVDLAWNGDRVTHVRSRHRFVIGRAPDCDLTIASTKLSRRHVELSIDTSAAQGPRITASDLGSHLGTFWDGEPIEPGAPCPLEHAGTLALGVATTVKVEPVTAPGGTVLGALLSCDEARGACWLYLPAGGPLVLAPGFSVPARLWFADGFVVLDLAGGVHAKLANRPLAVGAAVDLLRGDRLTLRDAPLWIEVTA